MAQVRRAPRSPVEADLSLPDVTKQLGTDRGAGEYWSVMGNSQGRDNVKKRASRRKKTERLAAAKARKKTAK